MATALKRTIIVLSVLLGLEMIAIGNAISGSHDAYAASEAPASMLAMNVSDVAYKAPIGIGITSKKATAETVARLEKAAAEAKTASEPEAEESAASEEIVTESDADYIHDEATYSDLGDAVNDGSEDADYGDGYESAESSYDNSGYFDANVNGAWHSGADFMFSGGDGYDDGSGFSYTWYSENVLPGGGLNIPGRHVGDEGYVCDGDGNICIASDDLPEGTVVNVPFGNGTAVVYDSGSGYGNLDVYVSW